MAKPKPGMGRGLERDPVGVGGGRAQGEEELRELPVELISPNPQQPRRRFDQEALEALAGSLGERGVLQPVLVRPRPGGSYELVAGERRWRAAQHRGPAEHPGDRARARGRGRAGSGAGREHGAGGSQPDRGGARVRGARGGAGPDARGRRPARGRSRVAVSNLMRLLDLPDEAVELMQEGDLSEGHGRALLLADGPR